MGSLVVLQMYTDNISVQGTSSGMVVIDSSRHPYATSSFRSSGVEFANEAQLYQIPTSFMKG
jgi:hypothetical protein